MDQNEMCRLITTRHQKLKALREQAANDNPSIKRLFIGSIKILLQDEKTQQSAYQEISQLIITASLPIAQSLALEIISRLKSTKPALQQYLIFWGRAYDGSLDKKKYPNFKALLQNISIKNYERQLSPKFRGYLQEFEKNYNQINDERVQFFEDFDDDALSQSIQNDSKIEEIIYLNIMELKHTKSKLEKQKLTEEAHLEQINKIRHFVSLKTPFSLTQSQKNEYEKQLKWAKSYLQKYQQQRRNNNSNLSINQTFNLSVDEQKIQIIDKKDFQHRRTLKGDSKKQRQIFTDSLNLDDMNSGKFRSIKYQQVTPIKKITQPQYHPRSHDQSINSSVQIQDSNFRKNTQIDQLRQNLQEQQNEESIKSLKIKKIPKKQQFQEQSQRQKLFSKTGNNYSSPRNGQNKNYQTSKNWKNSDYLSPIKNSRCKLSEFTSNKKQRKQLIPKQKITFPEEYAINPYLFHFSNVFDLTKFRRDCFEHNFTIYGNQEIIISCSVFKEVSTQIRLQITYTNNTNFPIQVENVYKIPKCYHIQKKSKISKKFTLHTNFKHIFTLDVVQFPLQACLINLKYNIVGLKDTKQGSFPIPITIINFVQYLHTSQEQWIQEWQKIANRENNRLFFISKHLQIDRQVVREQLNWILREYFKQVGSIQGYSIQDFGSSCFYPALNNLKFLIRLSVRVDNIISIQAISCQIL